MKKMIKRRRENEKKEERKGCNECALCIMSRDERNGKNKRVCNIWLCSMAEHFQTRFKSEQSTYAAPGMLVYFI